MITKMLAFGTSFIVTILIYFGSLPYSNFETLTALPLLGFLIYVLITKTDKILTEITKATVENTCTITEACKVLEKSVESLTTTVDKFIHKEHNHHE